MLYKIVSKFIEANKLLNLGDKVLVALSGGADSVALLRILIHLGYKCEAAHCNFHLRGEESNRDERFCRNLCETLNIPLHVTEFDTESYAETYGVSIEMAARTLRYDWFEVLRKKIGAKYTAVAHHLDDSVETFLLNLSRGTGIKGLKGISPKNKSVIRPLLEISRNDILLYLQTLNQEYVTDSTNLENVYLRNKIRLDIIPLFCQINPSFPRTVAETAKRLTDVDQIYEDAVEDILQRIKTGKYSISIDRLKVETTPSCILYEWLSPYGFNSSQIKDIVSAIDAEPGGIFLAKNGWKLVRERKEFVLYDTKTDKINRELVTVYKTRNSDYQPSRDKHVACLDADKLIFPLCVRTWKYGDKFIPLGMKHRKSVASYLRDMKSSLAMKKEQLVVLSGDKIVWLVDERIDNRYCITEQTRRVVELRLKDEIKE